jgi:hypothetical protein
MTGEFPSPEIVAGNDVEFKINNVDKLKLNKDDLYQEVALAAEQEPKFQEFKAKKFTSGMRTILDMKMFEIVRKKIFESSKGNISNAGISAIQDQVRICVAEILVLLYNDIIWK